MWIRTPTDITYVYDATMEACRNSKPYIPPFVTNAVSTGANILWRDRYNLYTNKRGCDENME